jgi:hypothetical protein
VLVTTVTAAPSGGALTMNDAASATVSGANFVVGTDNTSAFKSAISAAGSNGRLFVPPGYFLLTGKANSGAPITLSSSGGMLGAGSKAVNAGETNSVLFCGDETAGLVITGSGAYEAFECDGNGVATTPLQIGTLVSGVAQPSCVGASFTDIWVQNSAGNGFTIYGAQAATFLDCRSRLNADDGYYIDGGAGNLHFWHHQETQNGGHGVRGDILVTGATGTYEDHTEDVHFYSGICDSSSTIAGLTKVTLNGAVNWTFRGTVISGSAETSGSAVVIDQSKGGYGIEFNECWFGNPSSGAGKANIEITGATGGDSDRALLIVKGAMWNSGSNSVVLDNATDSFFMGRDWFNNNKPVKGPSGSTYDIDVLLRGRTGTWFTPTFTAGWSGNAEVRVNSDGQVQFNGSATHSSSGSTVVFVLPAGYRPDHTVTIPATMGTASSHITVDSSGNVTAPDATTSGKQIFLDGISFPVR